MDEEGFVSWTFHRIPKRTLWELGGQLFKDACRRIADRIEDDHGGKTTTDACTQDDSPAG